MATGRVTSRNTTAVIFDGILNRDPAPASSYNPAISSELDRIIAKALEKDRGLRYQTAADLRADLQRLRRDSSKRFAAPSTGGHAPAPAAPTPPPVAPAAPGSQALDATMITSPPVRHSMAAVDPALALTTAVPAAPPSTHGGSVASAPVAASARRADAHRGRPAPPAPRSPRGSPRRRRRSARRGRGRFLFMRGGGRPDADAAPAPQPHCPATLRCRRCDNAPSTTAPDTTAAPVVPAATPPPGKSATPGVAPGTAPAAAPGATAKPPVPVKGAPATPPPPDLTAEATKRMDVARAKLGSNLLDRAWPIFARSSPTFRDDRGCRRRAPTPPRVLAGSTTRWPRTSSSKNASAATAARGDQRVRRPHAKSRRRIATKRPRGLAAARRRPPGRNTTLRALRARIAIEERRKLKERDAAVGKDMPASFATMRTLADQFPTSPHGMLALYRLGAGYADNDQWEMAARAWTDLANRYPENPNDAWWLLGELYERRLRDNERAQAAYAQVPQSSKRYQDAQRKLRR
jgi:hypothetical protein